MPAGSSVRWAASEENSSSRSDRGQAGWKWSRRPALPVHLPGLDYLAAGRGAEEIPCDTWIGRHLASRSLRLRTLMPAIPVGQLVVRQIGFRAVPSQRADGQRQEAKPYGHIPRYRRAMVGGIHLHVLGPCLLRGQRG